MRCTSRRGTVERILALLLGVWMIGTLTACGTETFSMQYDYEYPVSSYKILKADESDLAKSFASSLCVTDANNAGITTVNMSNANAAGLFNVSTGETIYAKNVHTKYNPASLTKVMTALLALKYGELDSNLTVSENAVHLPSGASNCGLKPGDRLTLDQALHALLICSANDAAIVIAEGISGSVEAFAELMNEEAYRIGATNCHFMNPHGLTQEDHLITAYDMYLIFNAACQYDVFTEIISMNSYTTQYFDKSGSVVEMSVKTTNQYLNGNCKTPDRITVIGGKTGTTNAAGQCLILLAKDIYGNSYIGIILGSIERAVLYEQMTGLLGEVYKQ